MWESLWPFFAAGRERWVHAGRNLALALGNTLVIGLAFTSATAGVAAWSEYHNLGLLSTFDLDSTTGLVLALFLFDGWMYVWHRANHTIPFLWRFHRMHHSDDRMDVTTATRFHFGELALSALARLALVPILGLRLWHLLIYETLTLAVTQFHHANISLGRWDRWLRWVIVTPDMHKVHHSQTRAETDSNYSTLLPWWDYLAWTFRMRAEPATLRLGLDEFVDPRWQTLGGMLATPLAGGSRSGPTVP
jgi:sterol desaturase/sphingolipid hydroxylase (fatty acid hydroxylase superfamily)